MGEHTRRGHHVKVSTKNGYDLSLYPQMADDFEDHPTHVSTESAPYHYYAEPEECPSYCAEVSAERDSLASELALYKLKYGELLPEERNYREEAPFVDETATTETFDDQYEADYYYPESTVNEDYSDIPYEYAEAVTEYEPVDDAPYYFQEHPDQYYDDALEDDTEYEHDPLSFFDFVYEKGANQYSGYTADSDFDAYNFDLDFLNESNRNHGHSHGTGGHRH